MKVLLKRISLLSVCLLGMPMFMIPLLTIAEDNAENSGEMELKIDRIGGEGRQSYQNTETEMEKRFPHLFKEETNAAIESKQTEVEDSVEELEQSLFTMDEDAGDTIVQDTKSALFNDDYTAPQTASNENQEEEGNSSLGNALYIGFAGLASVLCVGVYAMIQRFTG
ncbi:type VII secretion protein EssA [Virgibacillus natechei]|uniref:Type VII secretion protein EssA n=1 Tax=Virgibacillus natechei TaxID=1216297 RepID=A0ABS4ICK4_9BACI|nr:type VII secretion protein EssA [Virgibacillus natechei]MBP1968671.1 type VII secretion protein EssA [Virgibacillus natechei]UZD13772.1 type VII secretion protein EssA [Virgibacillus natechei]